MANGLRFCTVDLHVHTPASKCFQGTITPDDYVAQAIAAGMDAIAITDHNTGDWIDRIKEAAAGTPLTVFPGVEISVQPGVHVVAIFPEHRSSAHVNDMLARMQLSADQRGEQDALVTAYGAQKIVSMIRDEGALPILAHIDGYKGVWRELSGQTRIQLWNAAEYAAVEIVGDELPADIGQDPYLHRPAYYWASDNPHPEDHTKHSHLGIGSRCSLFKLDEPLTWEGLRLCFHDPAVRIRPYAANTTITLSRYEHPLIERVRIEGGFLQDLELKLNPNLNCIIGGRGTGKSTFLELLRYAFDIAPKTEANRVQAQSIIQHAFPSGSCITVDITTGGSGYRIERPAGEPPRVFRRDGMQPLDVAPAMLLPVQAYGQKEIYEISRDPQFQLRLLDNYVAEALQPLIAREKDVVRQLEANATGILRKKEGIEEAQQKLARLGAIQEELRRMQEQDFVERLQEKQTFEREKRVLERAQEEVDGVLMALDAFLEKERPDTGELAEGEKSLPSQALFAQEKELLAQIDAAMEAALTRLKVEIQTIWATGREARLAWMESYQEQEAAYQALLREFQSAGEHLSLDRYVQLQNQLMELEELARETEQEHQRVNQLYARRRELLAGLRQIRRQQYELRRQKAAALTETLDEMVRVTIHPAGNRQVFADYLEELFRGRRIQTATRKQLAEMEAGAPERAGQKPVKIKGETHFIIPRIPAYRDPVELAAAIREEWRDHHGAATPLEQQWQISSEAMRRNLAGLEEAQLFELETVAVPDLPLIELQVSSGALGYRPLSALSIGQKCTALLAIVLLESPATLLVDQPEDDLDNKFIFENIVATLRREKEQRQFIIATHNANIPVSGDAELIIVVDAQENRGWVVEDGVGSIDAEAIKRYVEGILEGGQQAFKIRSEKYGRV